MSLSEEIEELEDRIEELEDENSDLESQVDELVDEKEELEREVERLKSQVGNQKNKDYTIVEEYDEDYHSCLKDSRGGMFLCLDNIDELEDYDAIDSGIRLHNTKLYKWELHNLDDGFSFVLKRK